MKKNKICSWVISAVLVIGFVMAGCASSGFAILPDGTIIGANATIINGDVVIPERLGGIRVTAIGERAFDKDDFYFKITSVVIPDSVTDIGD
jgi:hypothetical protein